MPVTNENIAYISSTSLRTRLCCLLLWVSHNLLCAFKARLHIAFFVAQPNAIIVSHQVSNRFDTSAVDSSNKIAWKLPAVYTRSLEVVTQSTTKTALSCPAKIACVNGLLDHARFAIEIGLKEIILIWKSFKIYVTLRCSRRHGKWHFIYLGNIGHKKLPYTFDTFDRWW